MKRPVSLWISVCAAAVAALTSCSSYYSEHYQGALAGNANDQYAIGSCYDDGDGGVPGGRADKAQAAAWYLKAANQGHADAQNNLALLYRDGEGVAESKATAAAWFEKSAMQGNKYAQYNLGRMYDDLVESYEDDTPSHKHAADALKSAAHWYSLAAAQGHHDAQHALARCYDMATYNNLRRKKGVFFDLGGDCRNTKAYWALAKKWYAEAASGGKDKYKKDYATFKEIGSAVISRYNIYPSYLSEVSS